jgi:twinkle protein
MISETTIQEVKQRMDVVEVVSVFIQLKREGKEMVACCPFHNEKSPSFKVNKAEQFYKCFGCGKSGDALAFVQDYEKVGYPEAVRRIAAIYQIQVVEEGEKPNYTRPRLATGIVHESIISFFCQRGISEQTVSDFQISQSVEWMPKAKAEVPVINFNYFRDGELINIKYRAREKDFKLAKGAELIFYNMDAAKDGEYIIIVEGEMDALSIHESGVKNVVSVPNGAAKSGSNSNLKYLDNCHDYFKDFTCIVLCTDNDEPGRQLREELGRRLGKDRCQIVDFPDGCKDANDVLLKFGKPGVLQLLKTAHDFPIEGIMDMDEMFDEVQDYYMNGYPRGIKVGIPGFDDHLSLMPAQLTIGTGIPGSGKSEFADLVMVKAAQNHGWKWGICSFENQPSSLHVTKLMEKFTGKAFAHRLDASSRMNHVEFAYAANMVRHHFTFINVNQVEVTIDGILSKAKELVLRKGIHGLLIDPWNYIEHHIANGQSETQYVSECLTKLKAFCLVTGVHTILIAHPVKMPKTNGKYEVPTLYNISGSAHFFNKTDNGIAVYRDFETNTVDVHIQKVRYSWLGKIGCASFRYDTEIRQYIPLENF